MTEVEAMNDTRGISHFSICISSSFFYLLILVFGIYCLLSPFSLPPVPPLGHQDRAERWHGGSHVLYHSLRSFTSFTHPTLIENK